MPKTRARHGRRLANRLPKKVQKTFFSMGRSIGYRAGLLDAIKDACTFCGGRTLGWDAAVGPNRAGNWTHTYHGFDREALCSASGIHARLAALDAKAKETSR